MNLWQAIALAKRILEKPWVQAILGFLKRLVDQPCPAEKKDAKGWTKTGRETFDNRLDPKDH